MYGKMSWMIFVAPDGQRCCVLDRINHDNTNAATTRISIFIDHSCPEEHYLRNNLGKPGVSRGEYWRTGHVQASQLGLSGIQTSTCFEQEALESTSEQLPFVQC